MKHQYLCAVMCAALIGTTMHTNAQTVADFDTTTIPGTAISLSASIPTPTLVDTQYSFSSGNLLLKATKYTWGGFNYWDLSRSTDTVIGSIFNDKSAKSGIGQGGSAQYTVCYLPSNWPDYPNESYPVPAYLTGTAVGNYVAGAYFNNTTYSYGYFEDNYNPGDSFVITIKAMHDGVLSADSVSFNMAYVDGSDFHFVRDWTWVPMLSLGPVDSLIFKLYSSQDFAPYYIAMDGLVTLDGVCTTPSALAVEATTISEDSAMATWSAPAYNAALSYEIAIDQGTTLAPTTSSTTTTDTFFSFSGLSANTEYTVHLRSLCVDSSYSVWDTVHFSTLPATGIGNTSMVKELSVYPNPTHNVLNIGTVANAVGYQIIDQLGRKVQEAIMQPSISTDLLPAGLYTLTVFDKAQQAIGRAKFVKK